MILKLSPLTLRDTLFVNYKTAYSFHRILLKTDLPYNFDQVNKYWWRWYSDIYGFYYNRVKRSYSIWLTMSLKQNIGVYMSFFLKMPGERSKILDKWWRKAYLYQNSLITKKSISWDYKFFTKTSFEFPRLLLLSEAARNILLPSNRRHRPLGSFGWYDWELDMFISSYNGNWNNLYSPESQFYSTGRMPKNFLIVVNNYFFNSGFFINSFDSLLILYPQYFLEYHNQLHSKKILNLFTYFRMSLNINLYINVLLLLFKIFLHILNIKFKFYISLNIVDNNYIKIYKLNLYLYFIKFIYKFNLYISSFYLYFYNILRSWSGENLKLNFLSFFFNEQKNEYLNIYLKYNNKILLHWKNIIENKYLDIHFKYLNILNNNNQLFYKKMINLNKLKKLFNSRLFKLWDVLVLLKKKHFTSLITKLNEKSFSNFLFSKISNYIIIEKFGTFLGINNLIKFLNQIKFTCNKKKFYYNKFTFIKPSRIKKNVPIMGLISWITKFNKHFVKLPTFLNLKTTTGFYYTTTTNTFRVYLYKSYSQQLKKKLLTFTSDIFNLILLNIKNNFGLSYNLFVNLFKRKTGSIVDSYYAINLQYNILLFLNFIKRYFYKLTYVKNFLGITALKKIKINERLFLSLINLGTISLLKNITYQKNTETLVYKYKGLHVKKFTYWDFTLGL